MTATVALMLAIFCIGIDMYVVVALIPTMATDLDEPVSALALLVSAYASPTALLAPFFGPLSDRYGRRLVMLGGIFEGDWAPHHPLRRAGGDLELVLDRRGGAVSVGEAHS